MANDYYLNLSKKRGDSDELQFCIKSTVENLLQKQTDINKPGILLGKIQSGKTRAFIGIVALAFDKGFDIAIILTKGTKALARQTYERLVGDFSEFIDNDSVQVFDIMHTPENLTPWELQQKIIMVVKKETNNLKRIIKALIETYPNLSTKKLLIIDDEADFASIGYKRDKEDDEVHLNKIPLQINDLRSKVAKSDYLQVTATPYSLYLQPETISLQNECFKPILPSFTVLLPTYSGYVGGDYYFENEHEKNDISKFIFEEIPLAELETLRHEDRRSFKLEEVLTSEKINTLRKAIVNFIVGATIRTLQEKNIYSDQVKKYSFIIHTEKSKVAHTWQESIVNALSDALTKAVVENGPLLEQLISNSYADLKKSLSSTYIPIPEKSDVVKEVFGTLKNEYMVVIKVNSEKEVEQLLDRKGQLKLRTPLNIFIGGQMLDRGITIENLIGFYYGRRPNKFQQDTVLQHSRMYGNRSKSDLAVTRFYTEIEVYESMKRINEFDNALRNAFLSGANDKGVIFIRKDISNKIVPCSPNKILISTTTTLKPYKRLLPVGFQTDYKSNIKNVINWLDEHIEEQTHNIDNVDPFLIDLNTAKILIEEINKTFIFEKGYEWDIKAFLASMEYLVNIQGSDNKIWCLIRKERNLKRIKEDGGFSDAPDTPKNEGAIAKQTAINKPILMLFRQNGNEELGWRGSPFWWPVLMAQKNIQTVIFASDINDLETV